MSERGVWNLDDGDPAGRANRLCDIALSWRPLRGAILALRGSTLAQGNRNRQSETTLLSKGTRGDGKGP